MPVVEPDGEADSGEAPADEDQVKGYLTLTCEPEVTVFIDSKRIRQTPLRRHELEPGTHEVKLLSKEHGIKDVFEVVITRDKVKRIKQSYEQAAEDEPAKSGEKQGIMDEFPE